MIVGNDVSEFQGDINWDIYKANTNFVIIRNTIGTARQDRKFIRNRDAARNANIPLGFYHYSYPQYNTPEAEADYFCATLGDIREGEIMVLDFEETWSGDNVDFCKKFLDRVASKMNGYKPLIYLNQSQLRNLNWKPISDAGYGLWVAAYTYNPNNNNFVTGSWSFAAMQQWTSSQQVPGILGNVDGNAFFGDVATFKKYGYKKPVPVDPCDAVKKELEAAKLQVTMLTNQTTDLNGKISQLQSSNKALQDTINSQITQIADLKTKINNAKNALA